MYRKWQGSYEGDQAHRFSGKIDEAEILKQLGKANTTLVSSGVMAVAGQALIPIPVVGMLVGALWVRS